MIQMATRELGGGLPATPMGPAQARRAWVSVPAVAALLTGLVGLSETAQAQADTQALQNLMLRNNCMACHLIDKRKYGPHFQEVAAKYAGQSGAVATLAAKIRAGGSGVWGDDMMPPQPTVTETNAKAMAELILALKP